MPVSDTMVRYLLGAAEEVRRAKEAADTVARLAASGRDAGEVDGDLAVRAVTEVQRVFGRMSLLLDQFEEILGDPHTHTGAIRMVRQVFSDHREDVRQLISMRKDKRDLLEPFEEDEAIGLSSRRIYTLSPLPKQAFESIVAEAMAAAEEAFAAGLPAMTPEALDLVVGDDPSALTVNATLLHTYRQVLQADPVPASIDADLAASILDKVGGADGVLRAWIESCLTDPDAVTPESLPWPGPRPYDWRHERYFKGRELETQTLARNLEDLFFSVMLAPSGAGKTSLIQAGLIPRQRRERLRAIAYGDDPSAVGALVPVYRWHLRGERTADFDRVFLADLETGLRDSAEWHRTLLADRLAALGDDEAAESFEAEVLADLRKVAATEPVVTESFEPTYPIRLPANRRVKDPLSLQREDALVMAKTMAARISERLVSVSTLKRPVERVELQRTAYLSDVAQGTYKWGGSALLYGAGPLKGRYDLEVAVSGEDGEDPARVQRRRDAEKARVEAEIAEFRGALESVFEGMLRALWSGSVLKSSGDIWELVHDGFAAPLRDWSEAWLGSPRIWFGTLYGLTGQSLVFPDPPIVDDLGCREVRGLVWRSCIVENANLRDIRFTDCDFTGTVFRGCVFGTKEDAALFDRCAFDDAVFESCVFGREAEFGDALQKVSGTSFLRSRWRDCLLRNARFDSSSRLTLTEFMGGTLVDSEFDGVDAAGLQLAPRSATGMRFTNRCSLRGGALFGLENRRLAPAGRFESCDLTALRFEHLDLDSAALTIAGCEMTGAFIHKVSASGSDGPLIAGGVLSGTVMWDCELQGAIVSGEGSGSSDARSLLVSDCTLDSARFENVECDGARVEDCTLIGTTAFVDCRLSRCSFDRFGGGGSIDLTGSPHLLYSRVPDTPRVVMTEQQRRDNPLVEAAPKA